MKREALASTTSVIDVAAWVGNYPFRGIPNSSVADLRRTMAELKIERAIVSPYESVFWENTLDAYAQWAETLANEPSLELWPVVRPGATAGLEKLLDRYRPRGLRLLPNYHGYRLSDAPAADLMKLARDRGMVVQVFARIADERWHHLLRVPGVDQNDLDYLTAVYVDQPVLISGAASIGPLVSRLRELPMLYADLSRVRGPQFAIEKLVVDLPAEKLVFGSLWPVQIIEATLWQITTAKVEPRVRDMLLHDNAKRLLAKARNV